MLELADTGVRGGAIALLVLGGVVLVREVRARQTAIIATAFVAGVVSYVFCSAPFFSQLPVWFRGPITVGCLANPMLFWLFARSIFVDGFRLRGVHAILLLGLVGLGFVHLFWSNEAMSSIGQGVARTTLEFLVRLFGIACVVAAMLNALRGHKSDLVESRRRFRYVFFWAIGLYMLLIAAVEVYLTGEVPHPLAALLNAVAILAIILVVMFALTSFRLELLLGPGPPLTHDVQTDAIERTVLHRLNEALANGIYRQPELTIGDLARALGTQEHRLRALINTKLGFRNFSDFLNRYRVADACTELARIESAGTPVLSIALNLGYGSIGPFNRAFKEITGQTPTQFRRSKLATATEVARALGQNLSEPR